MKEGKSKWNQCSNSAPHLLCHNSERVAGYLGIGVRAHCFPISCQMHRGHTVLLCLVFIHALNKLLLNTYYVQGNSESHTNGGTEEQYFGLINPFH